MLQLMRLRLGLSLAEFAALVTLLSALVLYLLSTLATDRQAQAVVELSSDEPTDMGLVAEIIERDIRRAGFMVPASGSACAVDNATAPDQLYLSNAEVLDPSNGVEGHDNGSAIPGENVAVGRNPAWAVELTLDEHPDYDSDGDGVADADFLVGGGVIVTDRAAPGRGSACGTVLAVDPGDSTMTVDIRSGALGPGAGGELLAIPAHQYRIDAGDILSRNGVELARGAADLQVAFFIDVNRDNVEQIEELFGDGGGPGYISGSVDLSAAREIRVNTILLARDDVPHSREGPDGVRRVTHTTRELLRNVVMR